MRVFISHQSALEFWTSPVHCCRHIIRATNTRALPGKPCTSGEAEHLLRTSLLGLSAPLHIFAKDSANSIQTKNLHVHQCKVELLPSQSFWKIDQHIFIASPELCFLHAAQKLSIIELVKLGYEMCGTYVLDSTDMRGFRNRNALTSARKISEFADRARKIPGRNQAKRAARLILDSSASPMETAAAMMLHLPRKLGGFGLPAPELNAVIDISHGSDASPHQHFRKGDMVWKSEKLIVECESNLAHGQYANIARDSKRRNELLGEGYEVITLTYSEMLSSTYFNSFIKNVSKRIGYRIRPEYLGMTEARLALRKLALGSTQQSP